MPGSGWSMALTAGVLALACAHAPETKPPQLLAPSRIPGPAQSPTAVSSSAAPGARELPELRRELEAERVTGTIALYDSADGSLSCSDLKRCSEEVVPASTFKIPSSMIAIETGVVEGSESMLPWNGKSYTNPDWNRDLTVREAFRVSCVPCYQELARKVGEQRMREWVSRFGYGNRDISGGVDRFWLWGGLRISPLEQLDFLRRFDGNQLPISERTADIVRELMALDVTSTFVLRGKTGSTAPPDEPRELGWFVGWLELGERRIFFATLLDGHAEGVALGPARRRVTERALRALGFLPPNP